MVIPFPGEGLVLRPKICVMKIYGISHWQILTSCPLSSSSLPAGLMTTLLQSKYYPFSITEQLTCPPDATPLSPFTPPTPLIPQSSVVAESPKPSPSVEELPSQPPTNLESAQMQPLGIEEEIMQLEARYTNLVHSVLVSFQQAGVSFNDIQAYLMELPMSRQLQLGNLLQSRALQLSQASSISELFFVLSTSPYWNFLNPSLLSNLVEQFGDEQMKQQKNKYLEELRGFRIRTKVDDFMGKWTGTSQPNTQELVVELDEVWGKRNLEQLEQFRIRFSHTRSLEDSALPFKIPSINAVFSLPKSVECRSLHLEDLRKFFLVHQVLRVSLDGDCILDLRVCTFVSYTTYPYLSHIFRFIAVETDIAMKFCQFTWA